MKMDVRYRRGVTEYKIANKRILVTGGTGFIGTNIVKTLINLGAKVRVLDSSINNLNYTRKEQNKIKLIKGDIRDLNTVKSAMKDVEIVFHKAGKASVSNSIKNPVDDLEINTKGTLNVLLAGLDNDALIVHASSTSVYGEPFSIPINEEHPINPISPYGISKAAAENYCKFYYENFGLKVIVLRYFNPYGLYQKKQIIFDILDRLNKNISILEVFGTGNEIRDFIYISDVVEANLLVAEDKNSVGKVYNIGTGKATKIKDVVDILLNVLNLKEKTKVKYTGSSWIGNVEKWVADITKIKERGFSPKVTLEDGIRYMCEWYFKYTSRRSK